MNTGTNSLGRCVSENRLLALTAAVAKDVFHIAVGCDILDGCDLLNASLYHLHMKAVAVTRNNDPLLTLRA